MLFLERKNELDRLIGATLASCGGASVSVDEAIAKTHALIQAVISNHQHIYVIGNGGSSGIASHHANDLLNCTGVAAVALSDASQITCMANDYGYENVYARPLAALGRKNDLLIAISSSGKSKNILVACETMRKAGASVVTLSGFEPENPLRQLGDINYFTGVKDYGLVESAHFFILHTIVDVWTNKIRK